MKWNASSTARADACDPFASVVNCGRRRAENSRGIKRAALRVEYPDKFVAGLVQFGDRLQRRVHSGHRTEIGKSVAVGMNRYRHRRSVGIRIVREQYYVVHARKIGSGANGASTACGDFRPATCTAPERGRRPRKISGRPDRRFHFPASSRDNPRGREARGSLIVMSAFRCIRGRVDHRRIDRRHSRPCRNHRRRWHGRLR